MNQVKTPSTSRPLRYSRGRIFVLVAVSLFIAFPLMGAQGGCGDSSGGGGSDSSGGGGGGYGPTSDQHNAELQEKFNKRENDRRDSEQKATSESVNRSW